MRPEPLRARGCDAACEVVRSWTERGYRFEWHESPASIHVVTDAPPPPPEFYAAKELAFRMTMRLARSDMA